MVIVEAPIVITYTQCGPGFVSVKLNVKIVQNFNINICLELLKHTIVG